MKVAFSIALLATMALAYSVITNDFAGSKSCNGTKPVSTAASAKAKCSCCDKGSASSLVSTAAPLLGEATWVSGECEMAPCASKTSQVAVKQDGEAGSCCSKGDGQCCSKGATSTLVSAAAPQDGEATCASGKCASGSCCSKTSQVAVKQDGEAGSCCSKGDGQCCSKGATSTLVSAAAPQDGEATCASGKCASGSCCSKTSQVAVKQDGEAGSCCSKSDGQCCSKGATSTLVSAAAPQDGEATCASGKCASGSCCSKTSQVAAAAPQDGEAKASCCVAGALAKLPKMTYKVGTESTCCSKSAAEMAEKTKESIKYVVADKEFGCEKEAYASLVSTTESFVNDFVTPRSCSQSGVTTVCGTSCSCPTAAARNTELVTAAIKDVKVSYQVGDEKACCPTHAKGLAEKNKKPIEYVVGEEKTPCELHARMMAAQARYLAAVKAIETAKASSAPATTSTEPTKSSEG